MAQNIINKTTGQTGYQVPGASLQPGWSWSADSSSAPAPTPDSTSTPAPTKDTYVPRNTTGNTNNNNVTDTNVNNANAALLPTPARTADQIYQDTIKQRQGEIDAINAKFDSFVSTQTDTNKQSEAEANAIARASGLAGSPEAYGGIIKPQVEKDAAAIDSLQKQRSSEIQTLLGNISENATKQAETEAETARTTAKDFLAANAAKATAAIKGLAAKGIDPDTIKESNPDEYQNLLNLYNGDVNAMHADYISNLPTESIIGTPITSGNNLTYLSKDPLTGKIKTTTIDAGVDLSADKDVTAHSIAGVGIALVNKRTGTAKIIGGTAPKYKGSTASSNQAKTDVQSYVSEFQQNMKDMKWAGVNPDQFKIASDYLQQQYGTSAVQQLKTAMKAVGIEVDTTHK